MLRPTGAGFNVEDAVEMAKLAAPFDTEEQEMRSHRRKLGARRIKPTNLWVEDADPDDRPPTLVRTNPAFGTASLSRTDFGSTIFKANNVTDLGAGVDAEVVEEWVVEFCVHWYSPCATFAPLFDDTGAALETQLNDDRFITKKVRFARVNCATDKVLCNEQMVEDYPSVNHYKGRQLADQWTSRGTKSDAVRLQKWLHKRLTEQDAAESSKEGAGEADDKVPDDGEDLLYTVGLGLFSPLGIWAFWRVASLEDGSKAARDGSIKAAPRTAAPRVSLAEEVAAARPELLPQAWAKERGCIEI